MLQIKTRNRQVRITSLAKRRSLTVAQILDPTQRDEKCVREHLRAWSDQGVVRLAAGGKAYAMTAAVLKNGEERIVCLARSQGCTESRL